MSDFKNPLVAPMLDILQQASKSMSEHELMGQLKPQLKAMAGRPLSSQLALFQMHFLVMNALYQLQGELLEDGFTLSISPLEISLQKTVKSSARALQDSGVEESLRDYYLDWEQFETTGEADVEQLLNSFWRYYSAVDKQREAYSALGLAMGAEWSVVQKAYRHLVADKHPDRGGSSVEFMAIREAYEILSKVHTNH